MKSLIVEKLEIVADKRTELFAVVTPERVPQSVCASLLYEGHRTAWTTSRAEAEATQKVIESVTS
jgi:hypothetical protein